MKPLGELRDKWERQSDAPTPTDEFQAANFHFDRGRQYCADELQVWLREWHNELGKNDTLPHPDKLGPVYGMAIEYARKLIQEKILGTTQKAKQEGEK